MGWALRGYKFGEGADAGELKRMMQAAHPALLVQALAPESAGNERLLEMLGAQTLLAAETGSPLARKREVDFLLRVAGTTQIAEAIKIAGVAPGKPFVLVLGGDESQLARLERTDAASWERLERSEPSSEDMARLEKSALLDAEKG